MPCKLNLELSLEFKFSRMSPNQKQDAGSTPCLLIIQLVGNRIVEMKMHICQRLECMNVESGAAGCGISPSID